MTSSSKPVRHLPTGPARIVVHVPRERAAMTTTTSTAPSFTRGDDLARSGRVRKALVALVVFCSGLIGFSSGSSPVVEASYGCYGYTRDCTNPTDSRWNCHYSAYTPAGATDRTTNANGVLKVEARKSSGCDTTWSREENSSYCNTYNYYNCSEFQVWAQRNASPGASTIGLQTYNGNDYSKQLQDSARAFARWSTGNGNILLWSGTGSY